ncbi:NfeD family protein [Pseudalkalibacillus caeni]|uniref:Nodulation protein NfeD n=1 Tax=Exobacillus caeni TaxID=2574798 RepID=A0A5R9F9B9_9BACL|nr:NfeD family protein [Pseudalkalibacillus caeni]TLS36295.1 nodulation protein NfeD [Pseudalkalibacillus caeni]
MGILTIPAVGFLVVLLGILFLIGEILVKARGLFGLLGIAIMGAYFSYHLTEDNFFWLILLFIGGLLLIILDGKVINDGTFGAIGAVLMILSVAVPSPSFTYGMMATMGFIIGFACSFLFLKVFPKRSMWDKVTLKDRLTGELGYNSLNQEYKELLGKKGVAETPFRPIGTICIDGKQYSAITTGKWLNKGETVIVEQVDGTKILVGKPQQSERTSQ